MKYNRILCLFPVVGQPRDSKRVDMYQKLGHKVTVMAFERDYHKGRRPSADITIIGHLEHGRFFKRIFKFISAASIIRSKLENTDNIHASSPDMALLAVISQMLTKKVKLTLEVGDIRPIQVNKGLKGKLFRCFEKWLLKHVDSLIVTSPDFYDSYYSEILGVNKTVCVLENKLDNLSTKELVSEMKHIEPVPGKIRIGYFGVLRCEWTWNFLKKLANTDKYIVVVAGLILEPRSIKEDADINDSIIYLGTYETPKDMRVLYSNIDIMWACYPNHKANLENQKWARTNRFYECCFYKVPLISVSETSDGRRVKQLGIGLTPNAYDEQTIVNELSMLTPQKLSDYRNNLFSLPSSISEYDDEDFNNLSKLIAS